MEIWAIGSHDGWPNDGVGGLKRLPGVELESKELDFKSRWCPTESAKIGIMAATQSTKISDEIAFNTLI